MNARNVLTGLIVSAAAGMLASCGKGVVTYTVGGNITGATTTVLITLNGTTGINMSGDGNFKFPNQLMTDDTYNVQIADPNDRCTVANGAGTVAMINIVNVSITCVPQPVTQTVVRSALLSGASENPAVTTNARGVGGVIVVNSNPTLNSPITGGVTFSGLTPDPGQLNPVQIHQAPLGNPSGSGQVIIPLTLAADGLTAFVPAGTTLTPAQYTALLAGELYFNVSTANNQNGEIRGQIQLQGGVAASVATLDASQVVPPTSSTATGTGTLLADLATGKILSSYITDNVASPTGAGIHTSPAQGSNGASIVAFTSSTSFTAPPAGTVLTPQNLADFSNNLLYFEVDSAGNANGEIRGNIAPQ